MLSDADVGLVLDLLDAGMPYAQIAAKFQVSKSCVAHISSGRRRCQTVDRYVPPSVRDRPIPTERKRGKAVTEPAVNQAAVDLQNAINSWR